MKPQKGGEQHLQQRPQVRVTRKTDPTVGPTPALSVEEAAVVECLRAATNSLTARQLQARVACDPDALDTALMSLVERELVVRLNTIIPSYSYRPSSLAPHGG